MTTDPPGAAGRERDPAGGLVDVHGRVARDLRVSLTDRCNLRCTYCLPAEGVPWLPGPDLLTDAEVGELIRVAVTRLGVSEVRFTGGEPLLRPGLAGIVAAAAALRPRPRLSLTTNGIGLAARAAELRAAGLDRVNVSLDTLDPDRYAALARRRRLADTLAGIAAAAAAGLAPVKLNAVLMRGVNDGEAPDLLAYALAHGYALRFIEQMPLDAGGRWRRADMVTADEILGALRARYRLRPDPADRGPAPAETWLVDGYRDAAGAPARVGVIASVTRPFCRACDRTRLTADGQVRACLFARAETDLRGPLRSGADDAALAERWRTAMWGKAAGHGVDAPGFAPPPRPMSAIGG
ncbi:GTP 3',8-cyclase [Pilimelia anulata]|uniref:GTP 3',8-cyclase n=1 Tax=Pilimelia anulata TaxID=53371 RepID=A0A8J3B1F7_9ACTN|nr:GTP 3',8-cyclase MoaA [Pilimelia anulata]GGJ87721.1 GTP 3',8-cyclase [Pilimelia anulata]